MINLFGKKKVTPAIPNLREIAETTLRCREHDGWIYRPGVVDEAVSRASAAQDKEAIIDAIESAFVEYEMGNSIHDGFASLRECG